MELLHKYCRGIFELHNSVKGQGVVPVEEWDTMMNACKQQLPTTFRINQCTAFSGRCVYNHTWILLRVLVSSRLTKHRYRIREDMETKFQWGKNEVVHEGEIIEPPRYYSNAFKAICTYALCSQTYTPLTLSLFPNTHQALVMVPRQQCMAHRYEQESASKARHIEGDNTTNTMCYSDDMMATQ